MAASGAKLNNDGSGVTLLLSNGTTYDADILIVADGSKSRVRQYCLPEEKLSFTGIAILAGQSRLPTMPPMLKQSNSFYMGRGSNIFMAPASDNEVVFGMGLPCKEPRREVREGDAHYNRDEILKEATTLGAQFKEPFATVLFHAEQIQIFNGYINIVLRLSTVACLSA
jgi:2-polyprenyl-6-methoxyphenol hydroxylase-like FAD-dependent oxidoreductase